MSTVAVAFGAVLLILGVGGFLGSGMASMTALIPAAFGLLLLILGVIARDARRRRHAMHAAAVVALLGFLGTANGLIKVVTGNLGPRPQAAMAQAAMAALMLVFLVLCIRSFVNARRSGAL
jgi:heme A synthase